MATAKSKVDLRQAITDAAKKMRNHVAALQSEILALHERREDLNELSVPKSEFIERMATWVDQQAAKFSENAAYQLSAMRTIKPNQFADATAFHAPVQGGQSHEIIAAADTGPLLAFLFGDTIKEKFADAIQQSDYKEGPPAAERPKMIKDISAELDQLEFQEEQIIVEAEGVGIPIPRRPDARPEIVLKLENNT